MSKYKNILLTGAAGALGNQLRETLSKECDLLRISDKENLEKKFHNSIKQMDSAKFTKGIARIKENKDVKTNIVKIQDGEYKED